jgi:FkbM family methyltransferase
LAVTPSAHLFELGRLATQPRRQNEAEIRALSASAYLGVQTALCRVLGRFKMFVDTADFGVSPHLMLDGYWEMWLTEALADAVRPGMVAVDIGANLGYFTLLMADMVGPGGRVHAFEPNPPIAGRLRKSVSINGFDDRVTVHETALSDQDGAEMLLDVPEGEPKNAYLRALDDGGSSGRPNAVPVITRRLDSFADIAQADVIKIDADTAEEQIWRGMEGLLRGMRPMTIFLEFAAIRYADPEAFLGAIMAKGFALNLLDLRNGIRPATVHDVLGRPAHLDLMLALCR